MTQHKPRKRFGQNFLVDDQILARIEKNINVQSADTIVEIGPGLGAITGFLFENCEKLHVIEIDRDLAAKLRIKYTNEDKVSVHEQDALTLDLIPLLGSKERVRVVGNLPYNISTPLIFRLLEQVELIQDMYFMLQKEVVHRMAAKPGSKAYGRLSVMVQYHCDVESLFIVPPTAFNPAPKVDSAIVRLQPHKSISVPAQDVNLLERITRKAFNQRRKTLRNCLKEVISVQELEALDIDATKRPEQLNVAEYVNISNFVYSKETTV